MTRRIASARSSAGRTADLSDVMERNVSGRVTEEIARMEGERRFYDQQVALSTITVALHEPQR